MHRALFVVSLLVPLVGCVAAERIIPPADEGPSHWEFVVEDAMAPDFSGERETYPVLLVHQHHVPSARQKAERAQVVCLLGDGSPLPLDRPASMESRACAGPPADPPTGRAFVDREEFRARRTQGLAIMMDACEGGFVHLGPDVREFLVSTSAHDFRVRLGPNGTFSVDGIPVRPGTTLKVGYFVDYGDPDDEQYVRVAFEAPGRWRLSGLVGERDPFRELPARPDRGTGLVVETPASPASLREPVEAARAATPARVVGLEELRAVHHEGRLTELSLRFATTEGVVAWFGAGRDGGSLRLLGNEMSKRPNEGAVDVNAFLDAFSMEWARYGSSDAAPLDLRSAPDVAWSSAGDIRLALPPGARACAGECVMVREPDGWRELVVASSEPARGALTLEAVSHGPEAVRTWWHAPAV